MNERPQPRDLAQAQAIIARQAEEIEQLQNELDLERTADDLRKALTVAATAGAIGAPVSHTQLLEMIVQTAAHVISAAAGALFLLDRAANELVFEVAIGPKADEVRKFRVPMGHGIAGLVAVSGQPMAISDASSDPRQAADIARSVGYTPNSIICVPLFYNDEIIGVVELLDKIDGPSFTAADMEALGLFANQAAIAIHLSRAHQSINLLLADLLASADESLVDREELDRAAEEFAWQTEDDANYHQVLELAYLVREIAQEGEHEARLCQSILSSFAEYFRSRSNISDEWGAW